MSKRKQRYDYVEACDAAMYGDNWRSNTRKVLRKLVREAVIEAHIDEHGKPSIFSKQSADRIAKELVP